MDTTLNGHLSILCALKDLNANLSITNNDVHIAARKGHLDILRAMHGWDVDVRATNNRGNILHMNMAVDILSWLLGHSKRPETREDACEGEVRGCWAVGPRTSVGCRDVEFS